MSQKLIFTNDVSTALAAEVETFAPDRIFILVDKNTHRYVLPRLTIPADATILAIEPGDEAKDLDTAQSVWAALSGGDATRRSLLVNIGGGVVTDLGGFVAATFKRGIRFINIPTTLLAAVDAAVGGKTGVNFNGLKNEIGAFAQAPTVIISSLFFSTLPPSQLLSGYAEMLKHGLLSSRADICALLAKSPDQFTNDEMLQLLRSSVALKEAIVARDPTEKGERKVLNLGHTVGHAIESLALNRSNPVPHGYAVAWGTLTEMVLSHIQLGFESSLLHTFGDYIAQNYSTPPINCDDYPELLRLMAHDKKNDRVGNINFTLLKAPGQPLFDQHVTDNATITAALDITRDLLHA